MRISFGKMCRGDGIAYIEVMVKRKATNGFVRFSALSERGVALPIESYDSADNDCYLLVTPLLDTKIIKVTADLVDDNNNTIEFASKVISRTRIKWLSRLNYKVSAKEIFALRDVDEYTYSNQVHIRVNVFLEAPGKNEYIVKGYACAPAEKGNLVFTLLDSQGIPVDKPILQVGKKSESTALGLRRAETEFSMRLPKDCLSYCLVAKGADSSKSGFLCFDECTVNMLCDCRSPLFYKCTSPGSYKQSTELRSRLLSGIDKEDYSFDEDVLFSIVVPLYHTPIAFLHEMIQSVLNQLYQNWELILVNSTPDDVELTRALELMVDKRIVVVPLESNRGISENTNVAINEARGDYIVFFDHDDTLDPMALLSYAKAIHKNRKIDAIYCDEDFINEEGDYVAPHFKSDFNIDLLRCHNYITHLLAVRSSIAKELKLRKEFDGAQDYDFLLRLSERTDSVHHVRDVLYHWRISDSSTAKSAGNKSYADDAGLKALQGHIDRLGLKGIAQHSDNACFYKIHYSVDGCPLVSIVIPNKDCSKMLSRCIASIEEKTTYANYEIIVVENNSVEEETFECYQNLRDRYTNVKVVVWEDAFNYSLINNFGVTFAKGDYCLFLNNDTEIIDGGWIESMLSICQRQDVGIVGAKLLYPDNTIQHAGVMMIKCQNVNEIAGPIHVFNNLDQDDAGYMRRAALHQDLSAVTAACMMMKRSLFDSLGGFDETYAVAFNDIDLCLRVRELGYLVVYDPDAVLYHYESVSRGYDSSGENARRFIAEQGRMRTRWSEYYCNGDPYHSYASTMMVYKPQWMK